MQELRLFGDGDTAGRRVHDALQVLQRVDTSARRWRMYTQYDVILLIIIIIIEFVCNLALEDLNKGASYRRLPVFTTSCPSPTEEILTL